MSLKHHSKCGENYNYDEPCCPWCGAPKPHEDSSNEKEEAVELEKIEEEEPVHVDFDHKPADFGFADIKFFEIAGVSDSEQRDVLELVGIKFLITGTVNISYCQS